MEESVYKYALSNAIRAFSPSLWQVLSANLAVTNSNRRMLNIFRGANLDLERNGQQYGREALKKTLA